MHFRTDRCLRCARAFVLSLLLGSPLVWAQPAEPLRSEVAKPLQAAQEAMRAGNGADAMARIKEAAAVPQLNGHERYMIDRMRGPAAAMAGDYPEALRSFDSALASGRPTATERLAIWQAMVQSAQRANDAGVVARAARGYIADGGPEPRIRQALAQALYALQDHDGMVQALQALVVADEAAGRKTAEEVLKLLAAGQLKLSDAVGYRKTLERLVSAYPTPAYWADLIARLQAQPDFPPRLRIDALRLARQVGALTDRADHLEYVDLAVLSGQPSEALAAFDEGMAKGFLGRGTTSDADQRRRQLLAKAATEDLAQVAQAEGSARRAADGQPLVSLGLALTFMGQVDKGVAMMAEGIAKGVQRQPEEARLRWGVALWQGGRRAAAKAAWEPLTLGQAAASDLARLWGRVR